MWKVLLSTCTKNSAYRGEFPNRAEAEKITGGQKSNRVATHSAFVLRVRSPSRSRPLEEAKSRYANAGVLNRPPAQRLWQSHLLSKKGEPDFNDTRWPLRRDSPAKEGRSGVSSRYRTAAS